MEIIRALFSISKISLIVLPIIIFEKLIFQFINYVTSFCNSVSIFHFWVENKENNFLTMEPSQTINLIALGLIVVMHAGVLALRLGISLART